MLATTSKTKGDDQLWDAIRQYGCIVCRLYHFVYSEPEIHHILSGGRRISHKRVLGLCPRHHRQPGEGYESRHSANGSSGKAAFEEAYGDETWLFNAQAKLHNHYFKGIGIVICYKGRTYCDVYKRCSKGGGCDRALTPEVVEAAKEADLFVSCFVGMPGCFVEVRNDK